MSFMKVPREVAEFLVEQCGSMGYELVDIRTKPGRTTHFEIVIDKKGGISASECGELNKIVGRWFEKEGMYANGYVVDVSSPGLDRELDTERSFEWAREREVEVRLHEPMDGKNMLTGKLISGNKETGLVLEDGTEGKITVDKKNLAKVKLYFRKKK
ncbi:MAG: hypothetical protein PHH49_01305 [Candidatus Omnitrophica bacterium]|nr:hypothetical protein [Candidatus Omnitrophota bacterium]MDD5487580.1 hypothetical protein [Candidatus Omnitrophota bacterium]